MTEWISTLPLSWYCLYLVLFIYQDWRADCMYVSFYISSSIYHIPPNYLAGHSELFISYSQIYSTILLFYDLSIYLHTVT